jgi:[ribosomal protein S5]-alanine N-acetyltransferase
MDEPPLLTTSRLILRPFAKGEGKLLRELFLDPEVTRFLPWGRPFSEEKTEARLHQILDHWEQYGFGTYVIRRKGGLGAPSGMPGLRSSTIWSSWRCSMRWSEDPGGKGSPGKRRRPV